MVEITLALAYCAAIAVCMLSCHSLVWMSSNSSARLANPHTSFVGNMDLKKGWHPSALTPRLCSVSSPTQCKFDHCISPFEGRVRVEVVQ